MGSNRQTHGGAVAAFSRKERQARAVALWNAGWGQADIAAEFGVTRDTIAKDIRKAADELNRLSLVEAGRRRAVMAERLQTMFKSVWPRVASGNLNAIRVVLQIMEREARLFGLDAPQKVDIELKIRAMAEAEGYDPDKAMLEAEYWVKEITG